MSDATQNGLNAPRPPSKQGEKPARARFFSRLGLGGGGGRARQSTAQALIKNLQSTLPETDPLRRSRLQAHLFMGQLPAFPESADLPAAPVQSAAAAAHSVAALVAEEDGLSELRAEQAARAEQRAETQAAAAADPSRQRVASLREERAAQRREDRDRPRPASSLRKSSSVGRAGSPEARRAAERSPARTAVSGTPTINPTTKPVAEQSSNSGLNALLLLIMLLTVAVLGAVAYLGYNWFQNLETGDPETTDPINSEPDLFDPVSTAVTPDSDPVENDPIVDTTEPVVPDVAETENPVVEVPLVEPTITPEQQFSASVLRLETKLAASQFMSFEFVDETYTLETDEALIEAFRAMVYPDLVEEIRSSFSNPNQEQLDRWFDVIDGLF